jgi:hypothetical protein
LPTALSDQSSLMAPMILGDLYAEIYCRTSRCRTLKYAVHGPTAFV